MMGASTTFLSFEGEVLELERKADELERLAKGDVDFSREVARLRQKAAGLLRKALAKLDSWQTLQLALHPSRPRPRAHLSLLLDEAVEIDGGGAQQGATSAMGQLAGRQVVVLAYELEAQSTEQRARACWRVAQRAVALAQRLHRPLVILIDVVEGASDVDAEQGAAVEVGRLALALAESKVPSLAVVTGAAAGPLAHLLMIADEVLMMRYAALGGFELQEVKAALCAEETELAVVAESQVLNAEEARTRGFIDEVVDEPEGGAQRDARRAGEMLRSAIDEALRRVSGVAEDERLARRSTRAKRPRGYKER